MNSLRTCLTFYLAANQSRVMCWSNDRIGLVGPHGTYGTHGIPGTYGTHGTVWTLGTHGTVGTLGIVGTLGQTFLVKF